MSPKLQTHLSTVADKRFYYLKNNPAQQALVFTFGLSQHRANKWIHWLTPILTKALKSFMPQTNPYRLDIH
jgi:hypothetical protein